MVRNLLHVHLNDTLTGTLDPNTPHTPHCSQETSVARHQRLAKLLRRRPGMIHYNCRGIINPLLPHLGATIVPSAECNGAYVLSPVSTLYVLLMTVASAAARRERQ